MGPTLQEKKIKTNHHENKVMTQVQGTKKKLHVHVPLVPPVHNVVKDICLPTHEARLGTG